MNNTPLDAAKAIADQLTTWRRHLHQHPELSGQEEQTAGFVAEKLREFGLAPRERVGDSYGVVADLRVGNSPFLALRADMDALPIHEQTGLPFASVRDGVMHACGHDAHTAMLLGAAKLLHERRDALKRSIRLVFQPHEERFPGGAPAMIAQGALEDVEHIFGIHICSDLPSGTLGTRAGAFMAAVNVLHIKVKGRGGHAAQPNQCIDPVVTAAHIITALQTIVSRNVPVAEPAVVTVTSIHGGTADNVIPNEVDLLGTIRTFSDEVRQMICRRVGEVAAAVAEAHGAMAEVEIEDGYPVLVNDTDMVARAKAAAARIGYDAGHQLALSPQGGGEDFAYYCREIPGCFLFLGARDKKSGSVYPHHHPQFNIDEAMLPFGTALHVQMALDAGA